MHIEPFIRWAGGKTWLLSYISGIIENLEFEHYHEPFLGGGAVFFSLQHRKKAYLSDVNSRLINTYVQIRDHPGRVIEKLKFYSNTQDDYYRARSSLTEENTEDEAAKFIFLNQTSFNGIYRVNRKGRYNVPYGFRKNWPYDENRIIEASKKLKNTRISVGDFEINKYRVKSKDLVFLDPPYAVSHHNNGFIAYNQKLFQLSDQYRLKKYIDYIKRKNAYYILTNAAHPMIQDIFSSKDDRIIQLDRHSVIGGKESVRGKISEYIFTNIPEDYFEI